MNDKNRLTDFFGKLIDLNGNILDTDGEPIEPWIVALRDMAARSDRDRSPRVPNIERGKQVVKAVIDLKKLVAKPDAKFDIVVDERVGDLNLSIIAKSISIDDAISFNMAVSCADNISVYARTDGLAVMDIRFCNLYRRAVSK